MMIYVLHGLQEFSALRVTSKLIKNRLQSKYSVYSISHFSCNTHTGREMCRLQVLYIVKKNEGTNIIYFDTIRVYIPLVSN